MKSKVSVVALALFASVGLVGCGSNNAQKGASQPDCKPKHTFTTLNKGVLKVAVTEVAPYSAKGSDSKTITGIDGDIVTKIAEMECLTIDAAVTPYSAAIASIQSKRVDVTTGGWYRTDVRDKIVGLSDPMYLDQMALISAEGVDSIQALKGKKVGTVNGYIFVGGLQTLLGSALKVYPDTAGMLKDLETGRLQVAVVGSGTASDVVENGKQKGLQFKVPAPDNAVPASVEPAQICIPHTKGNVELTAALNADIAELHDSGELGRILEKYKLPQSLTDTGAARLIGAH